ncbi:MAG: hypothetical protein V1855_01720 [bacterium]
MRIVSIAVLGFCLTSSVFAMPGATTLVAEPIQTTTTTAPEEAMLSIPDTMTISDALREYVKISDIVDGPSLIESEKKFEQIKAIFEKRKAALQERKGKLKASRELLAKRETELKGIEKTLTGEVKEEVAPGVPAKKAKKAKKKFVLADYLEKPWVKKRIATYGDAKWNVLSEQEKTKLVKKWKKSKKKTIKKKKPVVPGVSAKPTKKAKKKTAVKKKAGTKKKAKKAGAKKTTKKKKKKKKAAKKVVATTPVEEATE